ncbi:LGFP repeat-containing protein [Corynebacterium aquatimens]|uniref:Uncharacterized protein with LGFP repeats n=1 Tax=Corynebacterium aquatimens TaxID=1190508 RepID=A0A931GXC0_9CORY|nr:hypothetical protein [Corynebacterium aquatimens]MBG6121214.1 uncharacterized protein with LGFP repeats [Corynebacterium aquatimens]WJY66233.1 LGFP repeat protein [Corynebacterium aquatimens]
MRNTTVRTFGAAAAALALSAGLVACGDDKGETTTTETSVVETEATETNVETNTVTPSEDADAAGADAEGETVEVETQDGEKVLVPAELKKSMDDIERDNWGTPFKVVNEDDKYLVEYDAEKNVVYSKETGGIKLVGEIARVWKEGGALANPIGIPVEAEAKNADDNGWSQKFENGTISWMVKDGKWTAETM